MKNGHAHKILIFKNLCNSVLSSLNWSMPSFENTDIVKRDGNIFIFKEI